MFDPPAGERIGEVWFTGGARSAAARQISSSPASGCRSRSIPTTSRRGRAGCRAGQERMLVHPRRRARRDARAGAERARSAADELRAAALDGSIEQLMDWRPVARRRFLLRPAGHDPRDRRRDFAARIPAECGRDLPALRLRPPARASPRRRRRGRVATPSIDHLAQHLSRQRAADARRRAAFHSGADQRRTRSQDRQRWVIPLDGEVHSAATDAGPGDCLLLEAGERVETDGRADADRRYA